MHGASLHRRHRFREVKNALRTQRVILAAKSDVAPRLAARIDSLCSPFGQPAAVYLPSAVFDPLRSGSKKLSRSREPVLRLQNCPSSRLGFLPENDGDVACLQACGWVHA